MLNTLGFYNDNIRTNTYWVYILSNLYSISNLHQQSNFFLIYLDLFYGWRKWNVESSSDLSKVKLGNFRVSIQILKVWFQSCIPKGCLLITVFSLYLFSHHVKLYSIRKRGSCRDKKNPFPITFITPSQSQRARSERKGHHCWKASGFSVQWW